MTLEEFVTNKLTEIGADISEINRYIRKIEDVAREKAKNGCACLSEDEVAEIIMDFDVNADKKEEAENAKRKEEAQKKRKEEIRKNKEAIEKQNEEAAKNPEPQEEVKPVKKKFREYENDNHELVIGEGAVIGSLF